MSRYVCVAVYCVEPGDTLYSISGRFDVPVELLMKANKIRNPYNLRIGTELCIPGPAEDNKKKCAAVHIVKPGDTLYMIAKMHKVTLDAIMKANPDVNVYNLTVGTELCIPSC